MKNIPNEIFFGWVIMTAFFLFMPCHLSAGQMEGYYWNDEVQPNWPLCIENSPDNGFIICGQTYSRNGREKSPPDALVIRIDSEGKVLWQKQFGAGGEVFPYGITRTSDNAYLIASWAYGVADSFYAKAWLIKIGDDGTILWQKAYGDNTFAYKAYELADHDFIVVGGLIEEVGTDWTIRAMVMKIESNGEVIWTRKLRSEEEQIWAEGATITSGSEFIAWGRSRLYKFNIDGTLIWKKAIDESIGMIESIVLTSNGDYLISATWPGREYTEYAQPTILRYGADGALKWAKILPVEDNHYDNQVYLCPLFPKGDGTIAAFADFTDYEAGDGKGYSGQGAVYFNEDGIMNQNGTLYELSYSTWIRSTKSAVTAPDGNLAFCCEVYYDDNWWGMKNGLIKTDAGNILSRDCTDTKEIPLAWQDCSAPSLSVVSDTLDSPDTSSIDTTPFNLFYDVVVNGVNTFCPVITQVNKLQNPLRLEILGHGFVSPSTIASYSLQVVINDNPVPKTTPKDFTRIIAKKDTALKTMLPKGVPVCIQIRAVDSQGREHPLYKSDCFTFTR